MDNKISLGLESGAEIKLKSGVQRKKNDKVDAERIADYAIRYQDKLRLHKTEDLVIEESKLVAEGKNKMTVINAVRAKIIHRMFVLIRDNRAYQPQLN